MRKLILCPMCYGVGRIVDALSRFSDVKFKICHTCNGSGRVWQVTKFEPYVPEEVEKK